RTFVNNNAPEVELKSDDFSDNLAEFIAHLKYLERSDYTIEYYRRELRKFMHTLEDMRFKTDLRAITGDLIESEYIRYMSDEVGVKHATIAATLRALRAFFNWAVSKGVIESSPMAQITIGVPKAPTIETFSREQLRDIFSQPELNLFVGWRGLTLMPMMVAPGVRVRELCDIKVDDIRSEDNQYLSRARMARIGSFRFRRKPSACSNDICKRGEIRRSSGFLF